MTIQKNLRSQKGKAAPDTTNSTAKKAGVGPIERSTQGLRKMFFDEIDGFLAGDSSSTRANTLYKLASGVMETVRLEVEVRRFIARGVGNADTIEKLHTGRDHQRTYSLALDDKEKNRRKAKRDPEQA